jgi:hypothetical protein
VSRDSHQKTHPARGHQAAADIEDLQHSKRGVRMRTISPVRRHPWRVQCARPTGIALPRGSSILGGLLINNSWSENAALLVVVQKRGEPRSSETSKGNRCMGMSKLGDVHSNPAIIYILYACNARYR